MSRMLVSMEYGVRLGRVFGSMKRVNLHGGACAVLSGLILGSLLAACSGEQPLSDGLYEREVAGEVFDITPVRGEFKPLMHRRGTFEYKCSECHNDFSSPRRQDELKGEHSDIDEIFDHGMNTFCVNCHHQTDRNSYASHDGSPISALKPVQLCSKCHGPTYRDWQAGVHGRQNGGWERNNPGREKLLCVQCHDPHRPKFAPMVPDPPTILSRFESGTVDHAAKPEPAPSAH
jgi:hypothetical protein